MRKLAIILATLSMAACSQAEQPEALANQVSANGTDYVATIRDMNPELRRATFLRAIRDAGQACQQVASDRDAGPAEGGGATWTVRCEDQRGWMIVIGRDGNAKVTGPIAPK